jgi:AAA ATPase domain
MSLLERGSELRRAGDLLSTAQAGEGSALPIEGPAGIGKSALVKELRERAATRGFRVLFARGAELEREFSFGVVRQLLEPPIVAATPAERERLLAGAAHLAEPAAGFGAACHRATGGNPPASTATAPTRCRVHPSHEPRQRRGQLVIGVHRYQTPNFRFADPSSYPPAAEGGCKAVQAARARTIAALRRSPDVMNRIRGMRGFDS